MPDLNRPEQATEAVECASNEEVAACLARSLAEFGGPTAIKVSSIAAAVRHYQQMPAMTRATWMKEEHGPLRYTKIKRGRTRLLMADGGDGTILLHPCLRRDWRHPKVA